MMIAPIPSSTEIVNTVAEVCGVPITDLLGYDTCPEYRRARIVGAIVLRDTRGMSYLEIARKFNRRNHSTAFAWIIRDRDDETRAMVERVKRRIEENQEVGR